MATTNIEIRSISSETVMAGEPLTFYGDKMAADHIAHFTPAIGEDSVTVTAHGEEGDEQRVRVTVPHSLGGGMYHVRLTTSMGNGASPAMRLAISPMTTSMGNGSGPGRAVVDTTSMGNGSGPVQAVSGSASTEG